MTHRIVVVEDEPLVRALFLRTLAAAGFDAAGAGDAAACRAILREGAADVVLLDLGLPGIDGLTLARELRGQGDVGLIVVSRDHAPEQRVAALELGCDDYLVKPVHLPELCARVQAVIRRRSPHRRLRLGTVTIDLDAHRVHGERGDVALTRGEFTILALLVQAAGGVVGRQRLSAPVSRLPDEGDLRTVDALVRRIRRKLEPHGAGDVIATVPGLGYRLGVPIRHP